MTIAFWCVFAAALMPYALTGIAKLGTQKIYNNKRPREFACVIAIFAIAA